MCFNNSYLFFLLFCKIFLITFWGLSCKNQQCKDEVIGELYTQINKYKFIEQSEVSYMGRINDPLYLYSDKKDSRIGYSITNHVGKREIISIMNDSGSSNIISNGDSILSTPDIEIIYFLSLYKILKVRQANLCSVSIIYTDKNIYALLNKNSIVIQASLSKLSDCEVNGMFYRIKKANINDFYSLCSAISR